MTELHPTEVVLGGPGAGKTTELLRLAEGELARGVAPDRLAFLAFTRAAASEARGRASAELGLTAKQLRWFRTLHSVAFEALGLTRADVLGLAHWRELGDLLGLDLGAPAELLDGPLPVDAAEGTRLRALEQLARARALPLDAVWRELGAGVTAARLDQYASALAAYKRDLGLVDFADMLSLFIERGGPLGVEVAFIDEAQDLTTEQWRAAALAVAGADRVYIAGDDDQAVYQWAGADVRRFLDLGAPTRVLPVSHRLPPAIFDLARRVAERIAPRYPKSWGPAPGAGSVARVVEPELVDLRAPGSWLLLARHRHQLARLARCARAAGVPYSVNGAPAVSAVDVRVIRAYEALRAGKAVGWDAAELVISAMLVDPYVPPDAAGVVDRPWTATDLGLDCRAIWHDALVGLDLDDREFYLACRRRGEALDGPPRARVATIHGAKGAEADRVLVVADLTPRAMRGLELNPAAEHRVAYVAATRAKQALTLIEPQTPAAYPWPALTH